MKTQIIEKVQQTQLKQDLPPVDVGDIVSVETIIRDGDKKRSQLFKGIIIAIKGSGLSKNFTIRKISFGVGVEKILPFHSPNIGAIKLIKKGKVRRSKLYYLRERVGKKAIKVKHGTLTDAEITQYQGIEDKKETDKTDDNIPKENIAKTDNMEKKDTDVKEKPNVK